MKVYKGNPSKNPSTSYDKDMSQLTDVDQINISSNHNSSYDKDMSK